MDNSRSAPVGPAGPQSRDTLKGYFRSGSIPTEQHYAALIDSTVNRLDDQWEPPAQPAGVSPFDVPPGWAVAGHPVGGGFGIWEAPADGAAGSPAREPASRLHLQAGGNVGIGTAAPTAALDVHGFVASRGRIGGYCDAQRPGTEVAADGQWHPIITGLDGLQAFEIVAAAYGPAGQGRYAITHATALSAYGQSRSSIRQQNAWFWGLFQKIQFRWTGTLHDYGLDVRTASAFGPGARIVYYITHLFDDRRPLPPAGPA